MKRMLRPSYDQPRFQPRPLLLHLLLLLVLALVITTNAATPAPTNLALNKPVSASGPTWTGLAASTLTDGNPSTFTHPLTATGTQGFFFQIDLGSELPLSSLLLRNRDDGCCPERLSDYKIELYGDQNGQPGTLRWSAIIRSDRSFSPSAGSDLITPALGGPGPFQARFIRVVNRAGAPYNPQVAEIEAYGPTPPSIDRFIASPDSISKGSSASLQWLVSNADSISISPDIGIVDPSVKSILVAPTASTTYVLTAKNQAGSRSASAFVGVDIPVQPPFIQEFAASSSSSDSPRDSDGDTPDWIELTNPNSTSIELQGYALTDDPKKPRKWVFPAQRIAARASLIVFASGKNRLNPERELHTNFELSAAGDYLALTDRSSDRILQQFPTDFPATRSFPKQINGSSFGWGTNGILGFLHPPTPNRTNGLAYPGAVEPIVLSSDRGLYRTNLVVSLSTPTPQALIRYTTNRSEPTLQNGFTYSSPLPISNNTILRTAAFVPGFAPAPVQTHSFVFPDRVATSSALSRSIATNAAYAPHLVPGLLDLPSLSLTTTATINGNAEVPASIEWLNPNGEPGAQAPCGVRLFGGAFTDFPKKSYRLYFRSAYGASKFRYPAFDAPDQSLAPVQEFDQLELRSGSHDMAQRGFYMSNPFVDTTLREMGHLNPHGRFVHFYINGTYWGLFHLRERWGADMHAAYLGASPNEYESINGNWNVGGWADPGTAYDGDGSTWSKIKSLRSNYNQIKTWLDVGQYIDFMLVWMFGGAEDEYRCVGTSQAGNGFKFYLNDADGWFCGPWYCAADNRTARGAPGRSAGDGPGSLFSMLFKEANPEYRILLADHIHNALFNGGPLTPEANKTRLAAWCESIQRAFIAEAARWNFISPAEWAKRRDYATSNWLNRRSTEVLGHWRAAGFYPATDAPTLSHPGGLVTPGLQIQFTGPSRGSIWFTTDGSDPRLPGGATHPSARSIPLTNAWPIFANTWIKCRTKNGSEWSALNSVFFQVNPKGVRPGELLVSEIRPNQSDDAGPEFIELLNASSRVINLQGVHFSEGLRFSFPQTRPSPWVPGQRGVIVRDLLRFRQRYGPEVPVIGVYSGRLDEFGERLTLLDAEGRLLLSFSFSRANPWPSTTVSTKEFSIVLAHSQLGLANPTAWRPAATPGGSPGSSDASPIPLDATARSVDLDLDGLPALLEYALGTQDNDPTSGPNAIRYSIDPDHRLTLQFQRNLTADDLHLIVDASLDLIHWFPAHLQTSLTHPSQPGLATESWSFPSPANTNHFLRLRVLRTAP